MPTSRSFPFHAHSEFGSGRNHGRPGRYARRLAMIRIAGGRLILVSSISAAIAVASAGLPVVALVLLVSGAIGAARMRRRAAQAAVGAAAERMVAAQVHRLRAGGMIWGHRPPGRRGDIDLVVLGPWIAAIEIKHGSGRVKVYADGAVKVGRSWLPGRPVRQAVGNAAALRRSLGSEGFVDAILCVSEMRGRTRIVETDHGEVVVTSARGLRSAIRRLPHRTSRAEGRHLAERILKDEPRTRKASPIAP